MFAFGADVALERVHLDLDALVLALGLRGFPSEYHHDDGDDDGEGLEGQYGAQDEGGLDGGFEEREGDARQDAPGRGAEDGGGFAVFPGDELQAGDEAERSTVVLPKYCSL